MSAPDPRGIAIVESHCEQRPLPESWRAEADRRSAHAELVHPNNSIVAVGHNAPFELTASMTIGVIREQRLVLESLVDRRSA